MECNESAHAIDILFGSISNGCTHVSITLLKKAHDALRGCAQCRALLTVHANCFNAFAQENAEKEWFFTYVDTLIDYLFCLESIRYNTMVGTVLQTLNLLPQLDTLYRVRQWLPRIWTEMDKYVTGAVYMKEICLCSGGYRAVFGGQKVQKEYYNRTELDWVTFMEVMGLLDHVVERVICILGCNKGDLSAWLSVVQWVYPLAMPERMFELFSMQYGSSNATSGFSSGLSLLSISATLHPKDLQCFLAFGLAMAEKKSPPVQVENPLVDMGNPLVDMGSPQVQVENPQVQVENPQVQVENPQVQVENLQEETMMEDPVPVPDDAWIVGAWLLAAVTGSFVGQRTLAQGLITSSSAQLIAWIYEACEKPCCETLLPVCLSLAQSMYDLLLQSSSVLKGKKLEVSQTKFESLVGLRVCGLLELCWSRNAFCRPAMARWFVSLGRVDRCFYHCIVSEWGPDAFGPWLSATPLYVEQDEALEMEMRERESENRKPALSKDLAIPWFEIARSSSNSNSNSNSNSTFHKSCADPVERWLLAWSWVLQKQPEKGSIFLRICRKCLGKRGTSRRVQWTRLLGARMAHLAVVCVSLDKSLENADSVLEKPREILGWMVKASQDVRYVVDLTVIWLHTMGIKIEIGVADSVCIGEPRLGLVEAWVDAQMCMGNADVILAAVGDNALWQATTRVQESQSYLSKTDGGQGKKNKSASLDGPKSKGKGKEIVSQPHFQQGGLLASWLTKYACGALAHRRAPRKLFTCWSWLMAWHEKPDPRWVKQTARPSNLVVAAYQRQLNRRIVLRWTGELLCDANVSLLELGMLGTLWGECVGGAGDKSVDGAGDKSVGGAGDKSVDGAGDKSVGGAGDANAVGADDANVHVSGAGVGNKERKASLNANEFRLWCEAFSGFITSPGRVVRGLPEWMDLSCPAGAWFGEQLLVQKRTLKKETWMVHGLHFFMSLVRNPHFVVDLTVKSKVDVFAQCLSMHLHGNTNAQSNKEPIWTSLATCLLQWLQKGCTIPLARAFGDAIACVLFQLKIDRQDYSWWDGFSACLLDCGDVLKWSHVALVRLIFSILLRSTRNFVDTSFVLLDRVKPKPKPKPKPNGGNVKYEIAEKHWVSVSVDHLLSTFDVSDGNAFLQWFDRAFKHFGDSLSSLSGSTRWNRLASYALSCTIQNESHQDVVRWLKLPFFAPASVGSLPLKVYRGLLLCVGRLAAACRKKGLDTEFSKFCVELEQDLSKSLADVGNERENSLPVRGAAFPTRRRRGKRSTKRSRNAYIDAIFNMSTGNDEERDDDTFDDLEDFIVPTKKGIARLLKSKKRKKSIREVYGGKGFVD